MAIDPSLGTRNFETLYFQPKVDPPLAEPDPALSEAPLSEELNPSLFYPLGYNRGYILSLAMNGSKKIFVKVNPYDFVIRKRLPVDL